MELLVQVLLLIVGFVMLVKGADWFVDGAAGLATRFGIPQLVIGLTIVAMGTSAPEAAVSIAAALKGSAGIAVGNIVGSNILNGPHRLRGHPLCGQIHHPHRAALYDRHLPPAPPLRLDRQ